MRIRKEVLSIRVNEFTFTEFRLSKKENHFPSVEIRCDSNWAPMYIMLEGISLEDLRVTIEDAQSIK